MFMLVLNSDEKANENCKSQHRSNHSIFSLFINPKIKKTSGNY